MQFCKDCGGVLNLFTNNETDLCSACIQHQKRLDKLMASRPAAPAEDIPDILAEAVLALEENKMVLRSKEGWELWSAPSGAPAPLATVLARARRIYEIRLRRRKN